uniref:Muscarinic toxin-like protein n=1 Tax=Bungarus flaviceps TaxID=8614 RepID=D5J9Q3_9SAUR|nr:muscarinic toxin-like protein [Bungarus flaviceps]
MKTLLLTLVVVTIMSLDLGYTRMCNMCVRPYPFDSEDRCCPEGQDSCYKSYWVNEFGNKQIPYNKKYPVMLKRGCVTTCTGPKGLKILICCPTRNCNSSYISS